MKYLITGANGFIGSHLLKEILKDDNEVFAVIKDENEDLEAIKYLPHLHIVYCDLYDIKSLPTKIVDRDIDICIHLAWIGSSGEARGDYDLQLMNVKFALDVVKITLEMGIKRYVGAGTLAELDVLNYHSIDGATPNIVSMYGIAKVTMHYMTKTLCSSLGIEHVWCYLSNTYGVGNNTNNFVNFVCKKMLLGESVEFTSGEQMYDFVYITDTVRAIYAVASKGKVNSSYYLGSTQPRKLKEYIILIRDLINPSIELKLGALPFKGKALTADKYNTDKLLLDTGYKPSLSFEEGIVKTINWLRTKI